MVPCLLIGSYCWGRFDGAARERARQNTALIAKQNSLNEIERTFENEQAKLLLAENELNDKKEALANEALVDPTANRECVSATAVMRINQIR